MTYIIYWLGILVLSFSLLAAFELSKVDDELEFPKEAIIKIISILISVGIIMIFVSLPIINYQKREENRIKIELNSHALYN